MSDTPARILLWALLGATLALSPASIAFSSFESHPAIIVVSRDDQVKLSYVSNRHVSTILEKPPTGFTVLVEENESPTSVTGALNIFPENATEGEYEYLLALYSSAPYRATLSVLRYNETTPAITESGERSYEASYRDTELITELTCPANVAAQINLSLRVTKIKSGTPAPYITLASLPAVPIWVTGVFAVSILVFLTTSLLNVLDLERMRKGVWTFKQSAAATVIRSLLLSLLLSFLIIMIALLGSFLWGLLTGIAVVPGEVLVWTLLISGLPAITVGVVYRLAKWRGWYDMLDGGG